MGEGRVWAVPAGARPVSSRLVRATVLTLAAAVAAGCAATGSPSGRGPQVPSPDRDRQSFVPGPPWLAGLPSPRLVRPVATIDLPGAGEFGATDDGVWVQAGRKLHRIDPETNTVVETLAFDHEFAGAAFTEGAVWLPEFDADTIHRYDRQTGSLVASVPVGLHPNAIVVAHGSVWSWNRHGRWVMRIDPATNEVVMDWPKGVALADPIVEPGAGTVWTEAVDARRLVGIDAATNEVAANIRFPFPPCASALVGGRVWAFACDDSGVSGLAIADMTASRIPIDRTMALPGYSGGLMEIGDLVWTGLRGTPDGRAEVLAGLDPKTGEVVAAAAVANPTAEGAVEFQPYGSSLAFGAVWISTDQGVLRLAPEDLEAAARSQRNRP